MSKIKEKFTAVKDRIIKASLLKKIIILVVIIAIGVLVWRLITTSQKGNVTYETSTATKGTLVTSVSASGTVTTSNIQEVTTQASGVISKMFVEDGQKVTKGQKIAELELDLVGSQRFASAYSSYLSAQRSVNSANNSYRSTQASLAVVYDSIKGHDKDETLVMKETRTKAEVANDNAYDGTVTAKAALTSAMLSYNQSSPIITAPANGIVKLSVAQGSQISAGSTTDASNTRIATISTESSPIVKVSVSEIDVTQVKTGQKATLTFDSIEDITFTGKVVAVDNLGTSASNVVSYTVMIRLDDKSDKVLPNMAVNADIITNVVSDVITIPTTAIITTDTVATVQVMENGKISTVEVTTGTANDTSTEIKSGISEGDEVVTSIISATSSSTNSTSTSAFGGTNRSSSGSGRSAGTVIMGGPPGF